MASARGTERILFTSESVTEGHPDKLCDQISDGCVDFSLAQDPFSRVGCEAGVKSEPGREHVVVFGEMTLHPSPKVVRELVRRTLAAVGYTRPELGISAESARIEVWLTGQSEEIAAAINNSDELEIGACDQGMMIGFACRETDELMPLPIMLAHQICRRLTQVRKDGTLDYLGPDGKSQVTVEYEAPGKPAGVRAVVVSTQHEQGVSPEQIRTDIERFVVRAVIPDPLLSSDTRIHVNPSGLFIVGGPLADAGLTGRKIIVDTYGGMARHGGGAFSGKDPTKVDRSAAYAARWVAKNVVAAGLADRFEVQLAYAIGVARPVSISLETFGTGVVPPEDLRRAILQTFDLRPGAIIRDLNLRRPIYKSLAAYGHFGRTDIDAPWERTDRAESLRTALGAAALA